MLLMLAPMAGMTDLACRTVAKSFGCDFVVSEMVSAKGLIYENKRTKDLMAIADRERPVAIQLFGHEPELMAQAAQIVAERVQPDMIDLNMGCPTHKIVRNGDGSALLRDPKRAESVARAVVNAVDIPVTAKIRMGWDESELTGVEVASRLEQAGIHWISVHGRTREQFYSGTCNLDWIRQVKNEVKIPVNGNGDINSAQDAQEMLDKTSCDNLMIGRGVLGNPWLFRQIKSYVWEGKLLPLPDTYERVCTALKHLSMAIDLKGEHSGIREMRPQLARYFKGIQHSAEVRGKLNAANSYDEVENLLNNFLF